MQDRQETASFLSELVRRKVVRVGVTYIAVSWVLVQVADIALDNFGAPAYFMQAFMLFAVLGLPIVLILAWLLEVTPDGVLLDGTARKRVDLRSAIAVLPFSNMSSDTEIEHLADGLTDHLITECQQQLSLPVTSRNSTIVYKDQPIAIPVAARELNVAYILEGSIQKQGERIRVTAQLIKGADDSHLWASTFDKDLEDSFAVQDELTTSIVGALGSVLEGVEEATLEAGSAITDRVMRLPTWLTVSLGGSLILGLILALAMVAPDTLDWSAGISPTALYMTGAVILIVSVLGLFGFFWLQRRRHRQHVVDDILPLISRQVVDSHFHEAFDLAMANRDALPATCDDAWWDQFSLPGSLHCDVPGASLRYRPYNGRNVAWREIPAPEQSVRLPLGNIQISVSAPGHVTQEFCTDNPSAMLGNNARMVGLDPEVMELARTLTLAKTTEADADMQLASERYIYIALVGLPAPAEPFLVPAFSIDRYPVTNATFEAFVSAGGYANDALWQDLPWPDGVDWQEARSTFVDATGRPGPAGWELGKPPTGEASLPVTGVSWYEAAAYARFAGKRLPNVWQWSRAALPFDANISTINVAMMRFSNFFGKGKSEPGAYPAISAVGASDMFGNVREWVVNEVGDGRGNVGGCDTDEPYYGVWLNKDDAMLRSPDIGIRCVSADNEGEGQSGAIRRADRSYEDETPMSDEAYEAMIQAIIPAAQPTNHELTYTAAVDDNTMSSYLIDSGYGERFHVTVVSPPKSRGALLVFPGMGAFFGGEGEADIIGICERMSFVLDQLGYALVIPTFTGMYERFDGGPFPRGDYRQIWTGRAQRWNQEMTQAIELLKELPDIDHQQIGFLGISYGAIYSTSVIAQHPQFKTVMLLSGNMQVTNMVPINDSIHYYPRITAPTLMMNGRFDSIVSPDQKLLDIRYNLLGAPAEHKQQILYDAGHFPYPQHLFKKDLSDWLERYL